MRANCPKIHNQIGIVMANRFTIAFFLILFIEIVSFYYIGGTIGWMESIWWVLMSGILGVTMTRRQSISMLQKLVADVQKKQPPEQKITEGVLLLGGGICLITPGFFTDGIGLFLMVPAFRQAITPGLHRKIAKKINPLYRPPPPQKNSEDQPEKTIEVQPQQSKVFDNGGWEHPVIED